MEPGNFPVYFTDREMLPVVAGLLMAMIRKTYFELCEEFAVEDDQPLQKLRLMRESVELAVMYFPPAIKAAYMDKIDEVAAALLQMEVVTPT